MSNKKQILIIDPPDRRVIPTLGSIGQEYDFHFLIPIRQGYALHRFVEFAIRMFKPRNTRSISFVPFSSEKELSSRILHHLNTHSFDALLSFSERSTAIAIDLKSDLESSIIIPFGTLEDFNRLNDKYAVSVAAEKLGIPVPIFKVIEREKDLSKITQHEFPIILKCCRASGIKESMRVCHSEEEARAAYYELTLAPRTYSYFPCDRIISQEFIPGKIYDGCFAVKDGRVLAASTQVREWTLPPSGGIGAFNTTKTIPSIVEYGERLFQTIPWTGPAQLEFILDERTGDYKLIEINPRFWGTLGLSIKAGLNFPKYVLDAGFGDEIQPIIGNQEGIEFRWLLQETLTSELYQGKGRRVVLDHVRQIFSSEISNYTYSIMANLLISLPTIITAILNPGSVYSETVNGSIVNKMFL